MQDQSVLKSSQDTYKLHVAKKFGEEHESTIDSGYAGNNKFLSFIWPQANKDWSGSFELAVIYCEDNNQGRQWPILNIVLHCRFVLYSY